MIMGAGKCTGLKKKLGQKTKYVCIFFGIVLIWINGIESFAFLWVQIKIVLVIILTIYHEYLGRCMRVLHSKENSKSSKFFRIINEIPSVLLIFIVFAIIFKPL